MKNFVEKFVLPVLATRATNYVCEIGACRGESTDQMLLLPNVTLTVIDPCFDCDLRDKYAENPNVTVKKGLSLDVLPTLAGSFDCILIDGDHNWYTVHHELKVISERNLLKRGGFVFFHDVAWPYGRRDMYYQPELIPQEYRHSYARKGVVPGQSDLSDRIDAKNSRFCNATHEGGPRNGVLTAIEDFLREHRTECSFVRVWGNYGFGIMHLRNGFLHDLTFLGMRCKVHAYNLLSALRRVTHINFFAPFSLVRSLLK